MKRVAIIYTVLPVLSTFSAQLSSVLPFEVIYHHLLDDFLASDPQVKGKFTIENTHRLYNDLKNCEATGADLIITTCSTLTPIVNTMRSLFRIPIVTIDQAMCRLAIEYGTRITVLATAKSTIEPTISSLNREADYQQKIVKITSSYDEIAYEEMKKGELATHDKKVLHRIEEAKECDVIVLAQASMAHLAQEGELLRGIPVLGSTPSCISYVAQLLKEEM